MGIARQSRFEHQKISVCDAMKSFCRSLLATDENEVRYVPAEGDIIDDDDNIAMMTSEIFKDWIAKTIVFFIVLLDSSCDGSNCFL